MADVVEAHEAAPAPPQSKASMPGVYQDDAPTEPATSPRTTEVPVQGYIEELRLPTLANMVLMKSLRGSIQGGCPEMGILKRNGKRTSASTVKHGTTMT